MKNSITPWWKLQITYFLLLFPYSIQNSEITTTIIITISFYLFFSTRQNILLHHMPSLGSSNNWTNTSSFDPHTRTATMLFWKAKPNRWINIPKTITASSWHSNIYVQDFNLFLPPFIIPMFWYFLPGSNKTWQDHMAGDSASCNILLLHRLC